MRCTSVQDLMQPFLDGELDVETTVHLLKHLELCRPCRAQARASDDLRAALVSACRERLDSDARRAVLDGACGCEGPPSRSRGRAWVVGLALLLGALLAALALARP